MYGNGLSSVRFICGTQVNKWLTYGCSIYNGNKTKWSPVWSVIIQSSDLQDQMTALQESNFF